MVLYQVESGVITALSVVRETPSGWREHNNGFINRRTMTSFNGSLSDTYYTTDVNEAKDWSNRLISQMHNTIQVANASFDDLESWEQNGADESALPKSRFI